MNNPKLSVGLWRGISSKCKVEDDYGLEDALSEYGKIGKDEHDDLVEGLDGLREAITKFKAKDKETASQPAVAKYLNDLLSATQSEQKEIGKAQAEAEKADAKKAKQETDKEDEGGEDEEEEEEKDFGKLLSIACKKVKAGKGMAFPYLLCIDAKPMGVIIAKRISPNHRKQLTELTGGKRFIQGENCTCRWENGKLSFNLDKPISGLARKLQESIKFYTQVKYPVAVGNEVVEGEDETLVAGKETSASGGAAAPGAVEPPKLGKATLAKAPEVWSGTRDIVDTNIEALKKAVQAHYADEHPDLVKEIDTNMAKLDAIVDRLDTRLSDSLAKAAGARDEVARKAELKNAKTILADYIKYVKSEPMIAHIDANPFGVKTNLKKVLTDSLTHMAQSIG